MSSKNLKIYVTGHKGLVGSSVHRTLSLAGYTNIIGKTSKELNLKNQKDVNSFIKTENPDVIINCAGKVGGILANSSYPYEFLMDNMLIQNNLIKTAHELNIEKFIFLGSSCIYPKMAPQPLKEECLLTGPLEDTNQYYAIAKISGVKLIEALRCQYNRDYVSLMPTNLYGPGDNYDLNNSHVLPAMLRKFYEAKEKKITEVILWGTGNPKREFLHVDDLAKAVLYSLENPLSDSVYNIGSGVEVSIKELSKIIQNIVGYNGTVKWDHSKPDGTPRKLMDSSKMNLAGWTANIDLKKGIESVYKSKF